MKILTFDWCINRCNDRLHDIRSVNPKDVVKEETSKKGATSGKVVQMNQLFNTVNGASGSEQIASDPVLLMKYKSIFLIFIN